MQVNFGVRPIEHSVFEPVGLSDTKHAAGGHWVPHVCIFIRRVDYHMSIIGLATRPGTAVGHLRVPDLPRVSDALNDVLHLREFTNDSSGGIENDVVKKCSRGWVPS